MFGKKNAEPTIIGSGTVVEGKIKVRNSVQIDGHIKGNLEADEHVSIGPDGVIEGELIGGNIAIGGRVEGRVTSRGHLHMVSGGVVIGDVFYTSIEVDRGAVIDGRTEHLSSATPSTQITHDSEEIIDDLELQGTEVLKVAG